MVVDGTVHERKIAPTADEADLPRDRDIYQAVIYAALNGSQDVVVDYPVQGVTAERAVDPVEVYQRVLDNRIAPGTCTATGSMRTCWNR
ncbi:MAG: hypothetical protein ABEK12_00915 [Candidatus Nanohaloarchaea archaeon]